MPSNSDDPESFQKKYTKDASIKRRVADGFDQEVVALITRTIDKLGGDSQSVDFRKLAGITRIRPKILLQHLLDMEGQGIVSLRRRSQSTAPEDVEVRLA